MSNKPNYQFCIAGNDRLLFEGAEKKVTQFISDRLTFFGVRYDHCKDSAALEVRVRELLAAPPADIDYIVLADVMNPFYDLELVCKMIENLKKTGFKQSLCDGVVPGTEVLAVLRVSSWHEDPLSFKLADLNDPIKVNWTTQARYNNQLNLYKYKRIKLFVALTARFKDLYKLAVPELMDFLLKDEVFKLLTCFGDDVRQVEYARCPHCSGYLSALSVSMSQPLCGYLPSDRPLYHACESCGLVVQSPSIHQDDLHLIYDFTLSGNNPYEKGSVRCNLSHIVPKLPRKVRALDLGGGMGNFSRFLHEAYPLWDVTHSDFEIKAGAPDGVSSRALDFTRTKIGFEEYDLITAWEVIEHIPYEKLSFTLHNIWKALTPGGFFVLSTPDFDSPLCKSFDFYAVSPPFHYLVFSQRWLRNYFLGFQGFKIFDERHCSDFLDDALNWYRYGAKTCPSEAMRGTSELLHAIFEQDNNKEIRNRLLASGMGTEIVMTLQKVQ